MTPDPAIPRLAGLAAWPPTVLVFTLLALWSPRVRGIPPELTKAVPADVIATYFSAGDRADDESAQGWSSVAMAAFLTDQAYRIGLLKNVDTECRLWLDGLASLPIILAHPSAIILFDIAGEARADGGHELAGFHAAIVAHTKERNELIESRIQHWLTAYADSEQSALTSQTKAGMTVHTLRDRRLPAWATITWARVGAYYVLAVGDGTFDRVAATLRGDAPGLGADQWFARAMSALGGADATTAWYVRVDRLRKQLDSALAAKVDRVRQPLGFGLTSRGLWVVTERGRSFEVRSRVRDGTQDRERLIAGRRLLDGLPHAVVPDEATGFAAFDVNPRTLVRGTATAYLASRSPAAQEQSRTFWRDIEIAAGISIEDDILSRLTGPVIVHNHPRHALNLPLARTILLRIRGDADELRLRLDRLLETARARLSEGTMVRLEHDPDGVWYLSFGLAGPALAVTDEWVVVSFSPTALRQNLALLRSSRPAPNRPRPSEPEP